MRLDYQPLDIIYLLHTSSRHISLRPLLQESWHFFKPHMLLPGFVWTGPSDLHLFETRFVIGWEKKNSRDGHITMPLSLKTIIDSTGYRDQQNERFGWVQVTRTTPESGLKKDAVLSGLIHRFPSKRKAESCRKKSR